jgi:hypothetical protein
MIPHYFTPADAAIVVTLILLAVLCLLAKDDDNLKP